MKYTLLLAVAASIVTGAVASAQVSSDEMLLKGAIKFTAGRYSTGGQNTPATIKRRLEPISGPPLKVTVEEGYRVEEGFFMVTIRDRSYFLQGLIVRKVDAVGKLPIMLYTHGATGSQKERQAMTPRGPKDANLRMVRDYTRRGWLGAFVLRRGYGESDGPEPVTGMACEKENPSYHDWMD
jgi:hypothetical protein